MTKRFTALRLRCSPSLQPAALHSQLESAPLVSVAILPARVAAKGLPGSQASAALATPAAVWAGLHPLVDLLLPPRVFVLAAAPALVLLPLLAATVAAVPAVMLLAAAALVLLVVVVVLVLLPTAVLPAPALAPASAPAAILPVSLLPLPVPAVIPAALLLPASAAVPVLMPARATAAAVPAAAVVVALIAIVPAAAPVILLLLPSAGSLHTPGWHRPARHHRSQVDDSAQEGHVAGAGGVQQLVGMVKHLQDTNNQPDRDNGIESNIRIQSLIEFFI